MRLRLIFRDEIEEAHQRLCRVLGADQLPPAGSFDCRRRRAAFLTFLLTRILRRPTAFRDRNGFRLLIDPAEPVYSLYSFFYTGYLGYPEIGEQEYARKTIRPGMTVFDVGANIGQFSLLYASLVGSSGQVVAFEPCAATADRLIGNIRRNRAAVITVEKAAVHALHGGSVTMNIYPQIHSVWNTIGSPEVRNRRGEIVQPVGRETVPTVSIDGYCAEHGIERIDLLKIDVEGAELLALKGAAKMLATGAIDRVQFEVSKEMFAGMGLDGTEVFSYLAGLGFVSRRIAASGDLMAPVSRADAPFANFIASRG